MRSFLISAALIGLAGTARAEPPCGVRVLQAPDQLAATISTRIAALSACDGRLDVWIARNETGLFVIAKDALGRVRTRQVPDLDVAAALIASWVEMDAGAPSPAPALTVITADAPPPIADLAERDTAPVAVATGSPPPPTFGLGGFIGFTTGGMTSTGAAIDVDVWHHDGLTLAVAMIVNHDVAGNTEVGMVEPGFFREAGRWGGTALVDLRRRFGTGRWRITPAIGFGAGATRHALLTAEISGDAAKSTDTTFGFRVAGSVAFGVRIAASVDLELTAGWALRTYEARNGIDPTDHALTAGIGLRHDR